MALSPWPPATSAAARTAAIARLREAVAGRTLDSDDTASHLGEVASAMVEAYAPGAPQAVKDEAVVRVAGYLAGSDFGGIVSETSVGSKQGEYVTNHANAWRNSGAGMLLSRWKVRRAGAI